MQDHPLEDMGHGFFEGSRKATTRSWLIWLAVFFVGFAGEAWCVLEQVLTVPLTSDPATVEQYAPLQNAARWYLFGAAAFGVVIVVALVRLLLLLTRADPKNS